MAVQIVVCSVRNFYEDFDNPQKNIKSFCKDIKKKFNITLDAEEIIKQHADEETYQRLKTGVLDIYMKAAELSLKEKLPIFRIY